MKTCIISLLALVSSASAFAPLLPPTPAAAAAVGRGSFQSLSLSASPLEEVDTSEAPLDPFDAFDSTAEEIAIRETVMGTGEPVAEGDVVTVKYESRLVESQVKFGSTDSLPVKLGSGTLVKGFEQALTGKKVGSEFTVRIPSKLAWGNRGKESQMTGRIVVPPGSDIEFDVEVLGVANGFMGEIEMFGKDRALGLAACLLLSATAPQIEKALDAFLMSIPP
ncbi:MAG: hypothetical protein SGBAC_005365 [Bacillariaceae sp.]